MPWWRTCPPGGPIMFSLFCTKFPYQNVTKFHEIHLVQDSPETLLAIISNFHLGKKFWETFSQNFNPRWKLDIIASSILNQLRFKGGVIFSGALVANLPPGRADYVFVILYQISLPKPNEISRNSPGSRLPRDLARYYFQLSSREEILRNFFSKFQPEMKIGANSEQYSEPVKI